MGSGGNIQDEGLRRGDEWHRSDDARLRREDEWQRRHAGEDLSLVLDEARAILGEIRAAREFDDRRLRAILRRHPGSGRRLFSKNMLVRAYERLSRDGEIPLDEDLLRRIRMKPIRTISGVAPVTVLTRPHPCPGRCVFCPTDSRMPKSYLPDEPGAQRAAQSDFDPYRQVEGRIRAFHNNGHQVDKIELLILGGTWSAYPRTYQEWFVRRCLEAMNGSEAADLQTAQEMNESADRRNVGLVIETRPDHVDAEEIRWLRRLGVTKVQLGAQSLDDAILERNARGHTVEATRRAVTLLRCAGFKVVLHWMPNLLGATPAGDEADFARLFADEALRPDEIKIYPCSVLETADLYQRWRNGEYIPYPDDVLIRLVAACKRTVPPYCRINRVFRDIPATDIVAGSRLSNLRQLAQRALAAGGGRCACIRCREIRGERLALGDLRLNALSYGASASREIFLSCETPESRLAGYARLSLPTGSVGAGLPELERAALIRELHVYGPALALGTAGREEGQHRGLGTRLLERAEEIARQNGFPRLAVIASVGTRPYYAARGYAREGTYMLKALNSP